MRERERGEKDRDEEEKGGKRERGKREKERQVKRQRERERAGKRSDFLHTGVMNLTDFHSLSTAQKSRHVSQKLWGNSDSFRSLFIVYFCMLMLSSVRCLHSLLQHINYNNPVSAEHIEKRYANGHQSFLRLMRLVNDSPVRRITDVIEL